MEFINKKQYALNVLYIYYAQRIYIFQIYKLSCQLLPVYNNKLYYINNNTAVVHICVFFLPKLKDLS